MLDKMINKRLSYHQLNNINLFMRAVELKSLTKVAEKLDVSKSTVSKAIRLLEDVIELPLFSRSHKNFKLTPEGENFYRECIKVEREILNISAHIKDMQTEPEGVLTINIVRSLLCQHFLDTVTTFQETCSKMHVDLIMGGNKFTGDIHGGIYIAPYQDNLPDYIQREEVLSTVSMLCASPGYIKSHGVPQSLMDLADHYFIIHKQQNTLIKSIPEKLKKENIGFRSQLEINSTNAIKDCVIAGLGISELPQSIIESELEQGLVVPIMPQLNTHHQLYAYYAIYNGVTPTKVSRFLDVLQKKDA